MIVALYLSTPSPARSRTGSEGVYFRVPRTRYLRKGTLFCKKNASLPNMATGLDFIPTKWGQEFAPDLLESMTKPTRLARVELARELIKLKQFGSEVQETRGTTFGCPEK